MEEECLKTETKIIQSELLLGEYKKILQENEAVDSLPLPISGNSMSPFLIHGRDTVYLSRLTRPVRRGDAVLYQRRNGSYVFHRVYKVTPEGCTMIGDAQVVPEHGIQPEQIIAIMSRAERKGKELTPGCFRWEFFEKIWIRIVPLRPFLVKLYSMIRC